MRHTNYKATKKRGRQRIRPTKYRDFIINYTPDDIAHAEAMLTAAQIPGLSDMPKGTPDPHTGEARLAAQLDEIDLPVCDGIYDAMLRLLSGFATVQRRLTICGARR
jgi:hypothetical protein